MAMILSKSEQKKKKKESPVQHGATEGGRQGGWKAL